LVFTPFAIIIPIQGILELKRMESSQDDSRVN
jgi:hypothetical protein